MTPGELAALALTPEFDGIVLSGWSFTTNYNYTTDEVMLAFDVGLGSEGVAVWHYDGAAWSPFAADMLTYDANGIVSFLVTGFTGYAVTAVPEPAALTVLVLGGLSLVRRRAGWKS